MTSLTITVPRDPISGKLKGSYEAVAEGVNFIGTVGHGNVLTITDSLARFGARTNQKPLFVNLGDSLNGSSLGRITTQHINSDCVSDTIVKAGSLPSSWKLDIKQFGDAGISIPVITQDQTKPLIQYVERYYGFSYSNPRIQNNVYYFSVPNYANTTVFQFVIDGRTYTHTNDGTAGSISNGAAIRANLISLINADSACKCTAAMVGTPPYDVFTLTKKVSTDYFDVTYSATIYQNFNNKTNRNYAFDDSTINNARISTIDATSALLTVENVATPGGGYYNPEFEANTWMGEEYIMKNSSSANTPDGFYYHYKKSKQLNSYSNLITYETGEKPLGRCYLNQFSNGPYGYWQADLPMYVGYQCWDDEYNGIYLADSETIVAGATKLVRQPQSFWYSDRAVITQTESMVSLSGAYVHVRTGLSTYVYLGRLPV